MATHKHSPESLMETASMLMRTIETAMKDRAPALYRDLKESGELTPYLREAAEAIQCQAVEAAVPTSDLNRLPWLERVATMNARASRAREIALAHALEFPQDDTPESGEEEGAPKLATAEEAIKVPDKFPEGCRFGERREGGFFVEFPDGKWFRLSNDGTSLGFCKYLDSRGPVSEWWERSEAEFFAEAASNREAWPEVSKAEAERRALLEAP